MLAQVKLRFHNNRKEKMLVERRLKVTRKKTGGGLTMKTLEGNIAFVDSDRKNKGVSDPSVSTSIVCESRWTDVWWPGEGGGKHKIVWR